MSTKLKIIIVVASILIVFGVASGLWSNASQTPVQTNAGNMELVKTEQNLKTFTKDELKKFDGQNGNPAYIAVNGKVYDVTKVSAWKGGKHRGYKAGQDLTKIIKRSPHGLRVLNQLTIVGEYIDQ